MEKVLKVANVPQGKGYVPGIKISGKQLLNYNFCVDDMVLITYDDKKITIEKVTSQDLFDKMCLKNRNLKTLVKSLGLELV